MDIKDFENQMKNDIKAVFSTILENFDYLLNISAKSRSGAEISDYLEDCFVEYINKAGHPNIYNPTSAPKGQTKSPYDIKFNYKLGKYDELIWGDIKATKSSYADSNPDLGTPTKVIKFMLDGNFYLMFIFFEYESTVDNKTKFIKFNDGSYVKIIYLKDIHHSVRINPKPQFQVNIKMPGEYRTKAEFIDLFEQKYQESIDRIIKIQNKKDEKLQTLFENVRKVQLKKE